MQIVIQLTCSLVSAFVRFAYLPWTNRHRDRRKVVIDKATVPSLDALRILIRPRVLTFVESVIIMCCISGQ